MNNKFLKEAIEWSAKLRQKKFTRPIKDLECQRLFNETGTWDCCDECKKREKEKS